MAQLEQCVALWQKAYDAAGKQAGNAKTAAHEGDGDGRYQNKYDTANRPFVVVETDILDGVKPSEWVATVKKNLAAKFPDGVHVGSNDIKINRQTRQEMTFSEYTKWLSRNDKTAYADKFRATDYADEIILASRGYINEGLKHARKDNIRDFARGTVLLRIGQNDYQADVVVGSKKSGDLLLYDVVNMQETAINEKKKRILPPIQPEGSRSDALHNNSISTSSEKVNGKFQLKSATELEREVRELKKERRALENRNKVLTERVAKWRGELRRTETPSVRASDVKKLGRQFLSDYGSSTDYRAIEGDITALGKALMADDVSMDTLRPHARAAAEKIIDGVLVQAESGGELLAIRDHLKNITLRAVHLHIQQNFRTFLVCFSIIHRHLAGKLYLTQKQVYAKSSVFYRIRNFLYTLGGDKRDRTADLLNAIQALSQLSYTPIFCCVSAADLLNIAEGRQNVNPIFQKSPKNFSSPETRQSLRLAARGELWYTKPEFSEGTGRAMTDYFTIQLPDDQIRAISSIGLAHIGDGVYELLVRTWLCAHGKATGKGLHRATIELVCAPRQAELSEKILPLLTEEEHAVFKRGRNANVHSIPQHASRAQYQQATALEALLGWLYLKGRRSRVNELFNLMMEE